MARKKQGDQNTSRDAYDWIKGPSNKSPGAQAVTGSALISGQSEDMWLDQQCYDTPSVNSDTGVYKWETTNVGKAPVPKRSKPRNAGPYPGF